MLLITAFVTAICWPALTIVRVCYACIAWPARFGRWYLLHRVLLHGAAYGAPQLASLRRQWVFYRWSGGDVHSRLAFCGMVMLEWVWLSCLHSCDPRLWIHVYSHEYTCIEILNIYVYSVEMWKSVWIRNAMVLLLLLKAMLSSVCGAKPRAVVSPTSKPCGQTCQQKKSTWANGCTVRARAASQRHLTNASNTACIWTFRKMRSMWWSTWIAVTNRSSAASCPCEEEDRMNSKSSSLWMHQIDASSSWRPCIPCRGWLTRLSARDAWRRLRSILTPRCVTCCKLGRAVCRRNRQEADEHQVAMSPMCASRRRGVSVVAYCTV